MKCKNCGAKFWCDNSREVYCCEECKVEAKNKRKVERNEYRKNEIKKVVDRGCEFEFLGECEGNLNTHFKDGSLFRYRTGGTHSSMYDLNNEDFEKIKDGKRLRCLCGRHLQIVVTKEAEGWNFDEIYVYIFDGSEHGKRVNQQLQIV